MLKLASFIAKLAELAGLAHFRSDTFLWDMCSCKKMTNIMSEKLVFPLRADLAETEEQ